MHVWCVLKDPRSSLVELNTSHAPRPLATVSTSSVQTLKKTIFQIFLAVISRLPCLCTADSGTGPSPDLSILLHTGRTPLAQS
ncbi:hypothetical protein Q5P01_018291 [Channa striata]|uniref:Uncharacterized protein n=1 Tax=Channa striata TaxID=64152 RepID=A0AA88S7Z7_CHASR|nr:hypothetical protein Q5P01_018291 [Channa striata]